MKDNIYQHYLIDFTNCQCDNSCLEDIGLTKIYFNSVIEDDLEIKSFYSSFFPFSKGYVGIFLFKETTLLLKTFSEYKKVHCDITTIKDTYKDNLYLLTKEFYVPRDSKQTYLER